MNAITEPAAAAAASLCLIARMTPAPTTFDRHGKLIEPVRRAVNTSTWHPSECLWCIYPVKELNAWVGAFWSDADQRDVWTFERLPADTQRERVRVAQYGDEAESGGPDG